MEPCYFCTDKFNESLFRLSCGCQFHVYCLKVFFSYRIIPTCPKCEGYVRVEDMQRLQSLKAIKRSKMSKRSVSVVKHPNVPYCYFCRNALNGKKDLYRLNNCDHLFHKTCLKTYCENKQVCPIDGVIISAEDLQMLKNVEIITLSDDDDDCIILDDDCITLD